MITDFGEVEFDGFVRPATADGVQEGLRASVRRCNLKYG